MRQMLMASYKKLTGFPYDIQQSKNETK